MKAEERAVLERLDKAVASKTVDLQIRPVVKRVRRDLAHRSKEVMAWEAIPLTIFGDTLPAGIRSCWVFILRAGVNTGAERHPNSHQRMMSLEGVGDMQIRIDLDSPWQSNILEGNSKGPLEQRWISIPPNTWHQPVVSKSADWVVVSFHTVPAKELIEERPDPGNSSGIKQMRYLDER